MYDASKLLKKLKPQNPERQKTKILECIHLYKFGSKFDQKSC